MSIVLFNYGHALLPLMVGLSHDGVCSVRTFRFLIRCATGCYHRLVYVGCYALRGKRTWIPRVEV